MNHEIILPDKFTVRVYGILVNERNDVLLSNEKIENFSFTKFPGGGLEFGEGPRQCVEREFYEETGIRVISGDHIYTSDFFIRSRLDPTQQVIGIYYCVEPKDPGLNISVITPSRQNFKNKKNNIRPDWVPLKNLDSDHLTFEMDKVALKVFLTKNQV